MGARKPVLSPTRISTYLDCRRKYHYVYVQKLPRYFGARAAFSFGSSLHRALQEYHQAGGPDAENPEKQVSRLQEGWIGAGYDSAEEERERLSLGSEILSAYHESRGGQEGVTLFTEKTLRSDMGEYVLTGRLDRLDQLPDGALEVVDYKSGGHLPTPEEVGDDLALAVYQLLCVRTMGCPRVKASIYHLRTNQKISIVRAAAEVEPIAASVDAVFAEIQAEETFERAPGDHCAGCDFALRCWGKNVVR